MTLSEASYSMSEACYHLRRRLCCFATSMERCGFARVWRWWSVCDRPSIWTILCGCRRFGMMEWRIEIKSKGSRESKKCCVFFSWIRFERSWCGISPIRNKLCCSEKSFLCSFIARIALEVQSNRRVILLDNAFEDFSPADYGIVCSFACRGIMGRWWTIWRRWLGPVCSSLFIPRLQFPFFAIIWTACLCWEIMALSCTMET